MVATLKSKNSFSINQEDLRKVLKNLKISEDKLIAAGKYAMYEYGKVVMKKSKKYTPVDTNLLRDSAFLELPRYSGSGVKANMGYGNVSYAVEVHENLSYHHNVGRAKFFEIAIREESGNFSNFMLKKIKQQIKKKTVTRVVPVSYLRRKAETPLGVYLPRNQSQKRFKIKADGNIQVKGVFKTRTIGG